jgi:hypothetical protein
MCRLRDMDQRLLDLGYMNATRKLVTGTAVESGEACECECGAKALGPRPRHDDGARERSYAR